MGPGVKVQGSKSLLYESMPEFALEQCVPLYWHKLLNGINYLTILWLMCVTYKTAPFHIDMTDVTALMAAFTLI